MVFLQYPNGDYVGIDLAAGGFPYPVFYRNANDFITIEKAQIYMRRFVNKNFKLCIR